MPSPNAKLVQYNEYIDTQIGRTRRAVQGVDVVSKLMLLTVGLLGYLLSIAVVEHWIVPGGFGPVMRSALFLLLAGGVSIFAYRHLWPLVVRRINPVYAAQTIEQSSPKLKNSLLNLLLFRERRAEMPDAIYQALEEQAAGRLAHVPIDTVVDRSHLLRLGYVLLALITIGALYKVFSPKDPFITAGRVLSPWSSLAPASRVKILDVQPGTTTIARGKTVLVSAELRGITDDDPVLLRYTTDDRQAVDRAIPMRLSESGLRFECHLPEPSSTSGEMGIGQDLRYHLEAGDARSRSFSITVVPTPTILVQKIEYDYPDYTRFIDRQVEGVGDIRAIEGTRITIHARANSPIEQAAIDFEADGRHDIRLKIDRQLAEGTTAQGSFSLALRKDRRTPRHTSYVLRFKNQTGHANHGPVQYPIEVLPDYGPEVELLAPAEQVLDVRLDETIVIEIEASDPDFALREVRIQGEAVGQKTKIVDELLLDSEHRGRFVGKLRFTPGEHGLQAGDVIEYWATARDNRAPKANEAVTPRQTLRITSPDLNAKREPDQEPDQQERGQPKPDDSQQGRGGEGKKSSPQQGAEASPPSGQPQEDPSEGGDQSQQPSEGMQSGKQSAGGEEENSDQGQHGTSADAPPEGENGESQSGDNPSPVSNEGDDDGEAFERMQKHFKGKSREEQGSSPSDSEPQNSPAPSTEPSGEKGETEKGETENSETENSDPQSDSQGEGPGTETEPGNLEQNAEESDEPGDDSKSPGGEPTSTKGPSGAGDQPGQDEGSPPSQPDMRPQDKRMQDPSGSDSTDDQEAPAPSGDKQESDSQGEQGGDHSGGGEEGGGQKAPHDGTGSAGQNQSADEGAGQSTEQGTGENSSNAGSDAQSAEKTGQTGKGSGRETTDESGESKDSPSQNGKPGEVAPQNGGSEKGSEGDASQNSKPGGVAPRSSEGGQPSTEFTRDRGLEGSTPDGDGANLDYTRKQTDLVLERLDEQLARKQVDPKLLEKLGWTEDDLERFVQRWQQRRVDTRQKGSKGENARQELDDALRSLGLAPRPLGKPSRQTKDNLRDLRRGYRGAIPPEYQERLRAYHQGLSRSRQEER